MLAAFLSLGFVGQTTFASDITPDKVVELANQERSAQGLPGLEVDNDLAKAAEAKAIDMADKHYFAHISPKGITPWYWIEKSDYHYRHAGENLAIRFTNAEDEERAWMESPKHRENIMSEKYRDTGVAVKTVVGEDGQKSILVVQMFGTRMGESAPPAFERAQKPHGEEVRAIVQGSSTSKTVSLHPAIAFRNGLVNIGIVLLEVVVMFVALLGTRNILRCIQGLTDAIHIRRGVV